MSTFVGRRLAAAKPKPEAQERRPKGKRPTKAELIEEAEALGIEVPEGATNPEIAKLIAEAPVM